MGEKDRTYSYLATGWQNFTIYSSNGIELRTKNKLNSDVIINNKSISYIDFTTYTGTGTNWIRDITEENLVMIIWCLPTPATSDETLANYTSFYIKNGGGVFTINTILSAKVQLNKEMVVSSDKTRITISDPAYISNGLTFYSYSFYR